MTIPIPEPDRTHIRQPPPGARTLSWHLFKEEGDSWCFALPPYYAWLFEFLHPFLMWYSNTGWREAKSGRNMYAYFRNLGESETLTILSFVEAFKRYIIVGPKKALREQIGAGLDFCLALGRNFECPEHAATGQRTEEGQLEYRAKYRECDASTSRLAELLHEAFAMVPAPQADTSLMTYVPSGPEKRDRFYAPREIAQKLVQRLREDNMSFELTDSRLLRGKRPMKDLTLQEKIAEWHRIAKKGLLKLSSGVDKRVVYVVDDLYQSGASLNAFAGLLKSEGATHVLGLVCVKSLRDTDNV